MGRRLVQNLRIDETSRRGLALAGDIDEDVVEAAGRAHDLGHPPFGHIGEEELDAVSRRHGLEDGFEGNAQTFRVLVSLGLHKPVNPGVAGLGSGSTGLDLTAAITAACAKYPWARGPSGKRWYKFGFYDPDRRAFELQVQPLLPAVEVQTLESEIMDWADDITYAVHDVEDFFIAGLVPLDRLAHVSEQPDDADGSFRPLHPSEFEGFWVYAIRKLDRIGKHVSHGVRENVARYAARFPRRPFDETDIMRATVGALASRMITQATQATHVGDDGRLSVEPTVRQTIEVLKQLTWYYVIDRPGLATLQQGQRTKLRELTETLIDWSDRQFAETRQEPWPGGAATPLDAGDQAARRQALPVPLSERINALLTANGGNGAYPTRHQNIVRGVIDYVAGLRERELDVLHDALSARTTTQEVTDVG